MHTIFKKITLAALTIVMCTSLIVINPTQTRAVGSVPIDTMFNWHNIQQQSKDYILNALAWNVAKMALQQLTTSVVNWINTGFEGSPAFLTDPEGFFLDLGDQITGEFISNVGALQGLCSPWNIDIRLALGLGQMQSARDRYNCTLSSVIGNAKNATLNGYSIEGFTGGDFSQGGWPAFISLTSEPQNNIYGSYLDAKSQLEGQILNKKAAKNNDLNRGQGFLSYESCSTVVTDMNNSKGAELGLDQRDLTQLNNTGSVTTQKGDKYKTTTDAKTKVTTYKKCSVQTPGSVIGAGLNKSLGSGVDQLNLADSINEITSALFAQLITQVLTKGLGATNQRSSGQTQSYVEQLRTQSSGRGAVSANADNIRSGYGPYITAALDIEQIYAEAAGLFEDTSKRLALAQGCFQNITVNATRESDKATAQAELTKIENVILTQFKPAQVVFENKYQVARSTVSTIRTEMQNTENIADAQGLQQGGTTYQTFLSTEVPRIDTGRTTAPADLIVAKTQTADFNKIADAFAKTCEALTAKMANTTTR